MQAADARGCEAPTQTQAQALALAATLIRGTRRHGHSLTLG